MMKRRASVLGLKSPVSGVSNLNNNTRWHFELQKSAISEAERKFNLYGLSIFILSLVFRNIREKY